MLPFLFSASFAQTPEPLIRVGEVVFYASDFARMRSAETVQQKLNSFNDENALRLYIAEQLIEEELILRHAATLGYLDGTALRAHLCQALNTHVQQQLLPVSTAEAEDYLKQHRAHFHQKHQADVDVLKVPIHVGRSEQEARDLATKLAAAFLTNDGGIVRETRLKKLSKAEQVHIYRARYSSTQLPSVTSNLVAAISERVFDLKPGEQSELFRADDYIVLLHLQNRMSSEPSKAEHIRSIQMDLNRQKRMAEQHKLRTTGEEKYLFQVDMTALAALELPHEHSETEWENWKKKQTLPTILRQSDETYANEELLDKIWYKSNKENRPLSNHEKYRAIEGLLDDLVGQKLAIDLGLYRNENIRNKVMEFYVQQLMQEQLPPQRYSYEMLQSAYESSTSPMSAENLEQLLFFGTDGEQRALDALKRAKEVEHLPRPLGAVAPLFDSEARYGVMPPSKIRLDSVQLYQYRRATQGSLVGPLFYRGSWSLFHLIIEPQIPIFSPEMAEKQLQLMREQGVEQALAEQLAPLQNDLNIWLNETQLGEQPLY